MAHKDFDLYYFSAYVLFLALSRLTPWLADEAQGHPLAQLLNQAPGISRLLLPPWIGAQGARAMVETSS